MLKKNIKYSFEHFKLQLQSLIKVPGVSIIHYVNKDNQAQTMIGYYPKKIIHQTMVSDTQSIHNIIQQSLNNGSYWVVATSYEWGCAQMEMPTPHANAIFIEYDDVTIIDHESQTATQFGLPLPLANVKDKARPIQVNLSPMWDQSTFTKAVQKVKDHITEGDIYQLNLSYPAKVDGEFSIHDIYSHIVSQNSPRHGAFISTNVWSIASASPEEFFYINDGAIRTRPIKGTIGRQGDPCEDHLALESLKTSDKDHAELAMITDLMRNDLGQLSIPGSVNVTELSKVVPFPYVYHLVSTIIATLPKNSSAFDVLKKMAPGGSITGCPKRSACHYINSIESFPRDFYTGHIGFISNSGEASFNVAIRTCYQKANGPIITHSGCGITIDSDPIHEYQESIDKLRFLTVTNTPTKM